MVDEADTFPPEPPADPEYCYADDKIDEEYLCEICGSPLQNPVTGNCDHVFCEKCIDIGSSCPTCGEKVSDISKIKLKRFLALLDKIKIVCKGCNQEMERGEFLAHKELCPLVCPKECGLVISRKLWHYHSSHCDRMIKPCTAAEFGCTWIGPKAELDEHIKTCPIEKLRPAFDKVRNDSISYVTGHKYECSWQNGKLHGKGTIQYANNCVYSGEWLDGIPVGSESIQQEDKIWHGDIHEDLSHSVMVNKATGATYVGEWDCGQRSGYGVYKTNDGSHYKGNWSKDSMDGSGTYTFASGNRYEGEWRLGQSHGKGIFLFVDGHVFVGDFQEDLIHGLGTMSYSNGNKYTGEWKRNQLEGLGVMEFKNGDRYEGYWLEYRKHGHGTYWSANGDKYEGQWKEDAMNGRGSMTYANGDRFEGEWLNGEKHGDGIFITRNKEFAKEQARGSFSFISAYEQSWKHGTQNKY